MTQQILNNNELGLSFRTKINDNFTELYGWLTGVNPINSIDINGGNIDGVVIGQYNPPSGVFTTLSATSMDDTPIGETTPSTGIFTTLSATSIDSTPIGQSTAASGTFSVLSTTGDTITITTSKTPASASDTGTAGMLAWDSDYIYVCIATDTWVRSPLTTW